MYRLSRYIPDGAEWILFTRFATQAVIFRKYLPFSR